MLIKFHLNNEHHQDIFSIFTKHDEKFLRLLLWDESSVAFFSGVHLKSWRKSFIFKFTIFSLFRKCHHLKRWDLRLTIKCEWMSANKKVLDARNALAGSLCLTTPLREGAKVNNLESHRQQASAKFHSTLFNYQLNFASLGLYLNILFCTRSDKLFTVSLPARKKKFDVRRQRSQGIANRKFSHCRMLIFRRNEIDNRVLI